MTRTIVAVVLVSSSMTGCSWCMAQGTEAPKQAKALLRVDPVGKPKSMNKPGMYVWWEGGRWHVRTHGESGTLYQFNGTVRAQGGRVESLQSADENEKTKKKKHGKVQDMGTLNSDKTAISFAMQTRGAHDGFSFRVSEETQRVVFNVQVNRSPRPEMISVGPKGESPTEGTFMLNAHPDRAPAGENAAGKGP